jgi:hypothetical protein
MDTITNTLADLNALDLATPEERAEFWQGYENWLDQIEATFPPQTRASLLNRIAWGCTFNLNNFIREAGNGVYLVPSRSNARRHWRVTEAGGCECPDYRARRICAHWLGVGAASRGAFLIARIERATTLADLEAVRTDYLANRSDQTRKLPPIELEFFAAMEYHRRRKAFLAA